MRRRQFIVALAVVLGSLFAPRAVGPASGMLPTAAAEEPIFCPGDYDPVGVMQVGEAFYLVCEAQNGLWALVELSG